MAGFHNITGMEEVTISFIVGEEVASVKVIVLPETSKCFDSVSDRYYTCKGPDNLEEYQ